LLLFLKTQQAVRLCSVLLVQSGTPI